MRLVHTSEALERAQASHVVVPKAMLNTEGDSEFDAEEESESEDDVATSKISYWIFSHYYVAGDSQREVMAQYKRATK